MRPFAVVLILCALVSAQTKKPVAVRAHTTKQGVYVPAHTRTAPNKTERDNWSSKPNVNPTTGKSGTKVPKK